MISYTPPWAPWVTGTYPTRVIDPETQQPEPQLVRMACTTCGGSYQVTCLTGATRRHIQTFALVHAHRDPFKQGLP